MHHGDVIPHSSSQRAAYKLSAAHFTTPHYTTLPSAIAIDIFAFTTSPIS